MTEELQGVTPERPARRTPGMPWAAWDTPLPPPVRTRALLADFFGAGLRPSQPVAVNDVMLPPSRLPAAAREALAEAAGGDQVHDDRPSRLRRAGGKSTTDL